jgi:hypothetical protein
VITYVDTSTLLKLVIDEDGSERVELIWNSADVGDDAVHLAAALTIEATVMTSADAALCDAVERRGLHVANPLEADV